MESKKLPARIVVPTELRKLSCQIEQWWRRHPHLAMLPEPLWTFAANAARQHGLSRVARFLRLDYFAPRLRKQQTGIFRSLLV